MWAAIADTFNQKVHVSQQRYAMFCAADPSYTEYLTPDPNKTRFHSCDWDADCAVHEPNMISIHPQPATHNRPTEYVVSKHAKLLQTDLPYTCKPFKQMVYLIIASQNQALTVYLRLYLSLFIHLVQK
jgi:hypothetical protein